jgi:hypothetical protein
VPLGAQASRLQLAERRAASRKSLLCVQYIFALRAHCRQDVCAPSDTLDSLMLAGSASND